MELLTFEEFDEMVSLFAIAKDCTEGTCCSFMHQG